MGNQPSSNETPYICIEKANDVGYIIFVLITVFGIVGNIVCFLVVVLKSGKTPTNLLLSVIVFVDLIYLLLYLVKNTLGRWTDERLIFVRVVMDEVHRIVQLFSVWLVVLLACMRFMAIRKPYVAMRVFSMNHVKVTSAALLFICVCVHSPYSFVWINTSCRVLLNNTCFYTFNEVDRLSSDFMFFYINVCYYMCLLFILPCCLVSAFSVSLVKDLRRRRSRLLSVVTSSRRSSGSSLSNSSVDAHNARHKCLALKHRNKLEKEGYEVSKLVFTTVVILVVTYLSYFIFGLYMLLVVEYSINLNKCIGEVILHTAYIVSTINASVTFITNYIFRFSFRRKCSELCFTSRSTASRFWISLITREDVSTITRTKTSRL